MIHMICGPAGAGKTTHALKLEKELGAVRFSIDEWMVALFGEDSPPSINLNWIMTRVRRCEERIWASAEQIATRGVDVILDLGFLRAEHRQQYIALAAKADLTMALHVLDAGVSERWQRIHSRNQQRGETFHLEVTRGMFDVTNTWWEAPDAQERALFSAASV